MSNTGLRRELRIFFASSATAAGLVDPILFLALLYSPGLSPPLQDKDECDARKHRGRGIANAFLLGFVESLADFGNPLVLGGNFEVLSTKIFYAVVGSAHDRARSAVLALVLLGFTLTT